MTLFSYDVRHGCVHLRVFRLPLYIARWDIWRHLWRMGLHDVRNGRWPNGGHWWGTFKKRPKPDVYNPRRWGGSVLGFEVGSRG